MKRSPYGRKGAGATQMAPAVGLFDAVPVGHVPQLAVPGVQLHAAQRVRVGRDPAAIHEGQDGVAVLGQHVVQLPGDLAALRQLAII